MIAPNPDRDGHDELWTLTVCAMYLKVSGRTVQRYRDKSDFPQPVLIAGRTPRWFRSEVVCWVLRCRSQDVDCSDDAWEQYQGDELWTMADCAKYLDVRPRTIHRYRSGDRFPVAALLAGRTPRWFKSDILDWAIESQRGEEFVVR